MFQLRFPRDLTRRLAGATGESVDGESAPRKPAEAALGSFFRTLFYIDFGNPHHFAARQDAFASGHLVTHGIGLVIGFRGPFRKGGRGEPKQFEGGHAPRESKA